MQIDMNAVIKPWKWPNSARFLVAANFFPIVMVLFWGWGMADFLFLYWLESAIIGFFNIFKMILSAPHPLGTAQTRIGPKLDFALAIGAKIFVCAFFINISYI